MSYIIVINDYKNGIYIQLKSNKTILKGYRKKQFWFDNNYCLNFESDDTNFYRSSHTPLIINLKASYLKNTT